MTRIFLASLALLMAAAGSARGQVEKLYPVDEAHKDSTFIAFRLHLLEAVAKRDTAFIYDHLAPNIFNSFGGDGGVEEFKDYWMSSSPDADLWAVLARVVGGGGTYSDSTFKAPYYSAAFPARKYNAFEYGAVVGERVNVRARPDRSNTVLDRLSYDIVRVLDYYPHINQSEKEVPPGWVHVRLVDGREGYVAEQYIGSAVQWRAVFQKRDGQWLMTTLVAGD